MSRVGNQKIEKKIATFKKETVGEKTFIIVSGKHGANKVEFPNFMSMEEENGFIILKVQDEEDKIQRSMWGTVNRLLKNAIQGVCERFSSTFLVSQGFSIDNAGGQLTFRVGTSHPFVMPIIPGMETIKHNNQKMEVKYHNKQVLNEYINRQEGGRLTRKKKIKMSSQTRKIRV